MTAARGRPGRNEVVPFRLSAQYRDCILLVSPDEAISIATTAGIEWRAGIAAHDWHAIAYAIDYAIMVASNAEQLRSRASNASFRRAYTTLAEAIDQLFEAFGLDVATSGVLTAARLPVLQELYTDVSALLPSAEAREAQDSMAALPRALATVRNAACRAASAERLPNIGRAEIGLDALFSELSGIFFTIFGILRGSDRGSADNEAVLWTSAVLNHCLAASKERLLLDLPDAARLEALHASAAVELLSKATALRPAAVGERLRDGFLSWRKKPLPEKWPISVWCLVGLPTNAPDPFVPEWLRGETIPAL